MAVGWKSRGQNELARGYGGATLPYVIACCFFFVSLFQQRVFAEALFDIGFDP